MRYPNWPPERQAFIVRDCGACVVLFPRAAAASLRKKLESVGLVLGEDAPQIVASEHSNADENDGNDSGDVVGMVWEDVLDKNGCDVLQYVAVCCSVLWCVAVCCSVLQCAAVCCSMLQCVAVCCGVLLYVAVCCHVLGLVWENAFDNAQSVCARVCVHAYLRVTCIVQDSRQAMTAYDHVYVRVICIVEDARPKYH